MYYSKSAKYKYLNMQTAERFIATLYFGGTTKPCK